MGFDRTDAGLQRMDTSISAPMRTRSEWVVITPSADAARPEIRHPTPPGWRRPRVRQIDSGTAQFDNNEGGDRCTADIHSGN